MKPLLIFASGLLVAYLLRPRRARLPVADTEYTSGDTYPVTLTNVKVGSTCGPLTTYDAMQDGWMSVSWMGSNGRFTWSGM